MHSTANFLRFISVIYVKTKLKSALAYRATLGCNIMKHRYITFFGGGGETEGRKRGRKAIGYIQKSVAQLLCRLWSSYTGMCASEQPYGVYLLNILPTL